MHVPASELIWRMLRSDRGPKILVVPIGVQSGSAYLVYRVRDQGCAVSFYCVHNERRP